MAQKNKELLLTDLCARLSYGVMVLEDINKEFDGGYISKLATITEIKGEKMFLTKNSLTPVTIEEIRPYLRPMSSMTDEELLERGRLSEHDYYGLIDWLNAHHFDYRGLIEKGLALEAPEGMYNLNEKITMTYNNEDIAACMNDNCPNRLTCLRWQLGTNKDPYQTYLDGSMCDEEFYVENKER